MTGQNDNSCETGGAARRVETLVCGGGISGLSLAAWLAMDGREAHVLDKNADPGGVISSFEIDGFTFERGPNTVLDKYDSMDRLLEWAGLAGQAVRAPLASQKRWVWMNGALREAPMSLGRFLATPLLPFTSKLALLGEPFVGVGPPDESIADFVRRRLGEPWLANLITPMVSGIWAGNPEQLSIRWAFPIMKALEQEGGSLLFGAVRHMRRKAAERRTAGLPSRRPKTLLSFRGGLATLPRALAARLGERYHASTRVESIEPPSPTANGGGQGLWRVRARERGRDAPCEWQAERLAIAAEGREAAAWLRPMDPELGALMESFPYNRLAVASLGIERSGAPGLPEGFGFLVPRGQGLRVLGAIVLSNIFPDRAPDGCAAMSVIAGGELDQAAFDLADDELEGLVRRDLRRAIGWDGRARVLRVERWPVAIPQYDMRHGARMRQVEVAEARWPGLSLMGNWRGGVGVPDRVEAMSKLAQEIAGKKNSLATKSTKNA
jgi:oxygen-dependent protoporphyrinogen oxidase